MVPQWNLNDSKSPQVSRTLLSILSDLNNVVVLKVITCLMISKSSTPFIKPLGIVPSAPITIGITVTFMFQRFFLVLWQVLGIYRSWRFLLFFSLWTAGTAKSTIRQVLFFCWFINIIIVCLLCLFENVSFLVSSQINLKKGSLLGSYTLLINNLFTNKILLSNSSNSSQKFPLSFLYLGIFFRNHPI